MNSLEQLTDEQFERHALGVLKRELGTGGLARLAGRLKTGRQDAILPHMTLHLQW